MTSITNKPFQSYALLDVQRSQKFAGAPKLVDAFDPFAQQLSLTRPAGTVSEPGSAPLSDLYVSLAAAAVDRDTNGTISADEYSEQIVKAGGAAADAAALYSKLDTDADGSVTIGELAASLDAPTFNMADALLQNAVDDASAGQRPPKPAGQILNAKGQVLSPSSILQYMVQTTFADAIKMVPPTKI